MICFTFSGFQSFYVVPKHTVISSSHLIQINAKVMETQFSKVIRLQVVNEVAIKVVASVSVIILNADGCSTTSHTVVFTLGCPANKLLKFDYASMIEKPVLTVEEYQTEVINPLLHNLQVFILCY